MNRHFKLISLLVVTLAFSAILAGCGQQASSSAASSANSSASASSAVASSSATSASESASASSAASDAASSPAASAASASSASSATSASSAAGNADEVTFSLKIDATEAGQGILHDGGGTVEKGQTVYQVLVDTELPLAVDSSSGNAFVYGIGNAIADDGKAGWVFYVNGEMPSVSADKAEISDGDAIEWKYFADSSKAM